MMMVSVALSLFSRSFFFLRRRRTRRKEEKEGTKRQLFSNRSDDETTSTSLRSPKIISKRRQTQKKETVGDGLTRFEFTRPSVPFESSFWTRERGPTESAFLRKECNRSPSLCLSIFALPILERYECCCVYIDWRGLRKRPRARVTKEPSH